MTVFGCVVRWLRGRPVWAGNRYDPGDSGGCRAPAVAPGGGAAGQRFVREGTTENRWLPVCRCCGSQSSSRRRRDWGIGAV